MRALWMQCKIEILRTFRNKLFIFFSLLMPVMFYYIFTNVVQVPQNGDAWKAHYLISMATFSIVGTALFSFGVRLSQERGQGWTHLLKITPLPEGAYITAKIIAQTVVNAFSILVIFIAGILINHVELTVGQWIGAGLWLLLGVTPFLALGTVIGSIKKADAAAGLANILNMSLAIVGGLWMPIEVFPKMLRTIGEWTPTYHFGSGAWDIVAGKSIGWENIAVLGGYFLIFVVVSIYIRKRQEAV
ncbi:ABC transporter permease [Bacillus thuringiensis]|nr:ABC transporter permease [Bacillus thuringiensis]MRB58235.1 ABC transporter permease [Bacillus thuringiensis]